MQTRTETRTSTHAQHIASKVAADLKRIQRIYRTGQPTDSKISDYQGEIALLLDRGYLGSVTYGFQRDEEWIIALKYTAVGGNLSGGDDPGGIRYEEDVSDAHFTSFLSYSASWEFTSAAAREEFRASLPFKKSGENRSWSTHGLDGKQKLLVRRTRCKTHHGQENLTMNTTVIDDVFNRRIVLPDSDADERLARLIGMSDSIEQLSKILEMLLFPQHFEKWRKTHHPNASAIFDYVKNRHSLIIIAGDVGTGKTELSETIGSRVARQGKIEITLFPMSLSSRGIRVGWRNDEVNLFCVSSYTNRM